MVPAVNLCATEQQRSAPQPAPCLPTYFRSDFGDNGVLTSAVPSFAQSQAQPGAHSDPGPVEVYSPALVSYRVAYYYQFKGDQQRAIAKFTEAIEVLPNYAYAYAARGDSYALIGEYQAAIDD